jgi:hypothetical protein
MAGRWLRGFLVFTFALAVGHLAWHARLGPPLTPTYVLDGGGHVLSGSDPGSQVLYLRRTLYLTEQPRHAWLAVIGRDRLRLYVNGRRVGQKVHDGFPVGLVIDLVPLLKVGRNVLAINAEQTSIGIPPAVAVRGAYTLAGIVHPIESDASWRYSTTYERGASWWFSPEFQDDSWPMAQVTKRSLCSRVDGPPGTTTEPPLGRWIGVPSLTSQEAAVRRQVEVAARPRQAWLRVTATAPYLLAVNGLILDGPEEGLTIRAKPDPVQRTYDLTSVVRSGRNVVAFLLSSNSGVPHLRADLEVEDDAGRRYRLGTDETWQGRPGLSANWSAFPSANDAGWQPCRVETGDLGIPPWVPARKVVAVQLPWEEALRRTSGQAAVIALIALLTWAGCRLAERFLIRLRSGGTNTDQAPVVYLALVPATLALAGAILACYDPRVARQDVYRDIWVLLAVLSVPLQWGLLALTSRRYAIPWRLPWGARSANKGLAGALGPQRWAEVALLVLVVGIGFWLRVRQIAVEPLMWDEAAHYYETCGLLENGYPSRQISPDAPPRGIATSELMYVPMALVALVVPDPLYVVRLPALLFGTATIVLIYLTGRALFGRAVAWCAMLLYTFAPVCIAMSVFGRYLAQLQFFTLLTVYFFWLMLRPKTGIHQGFLWLTALAFCAMYLSWEASALLAPGMMLAALVQRRGRLFSLLSNGTVWAAMGLVVIVLLLQTSYRTLVGAGRLTYYMGVPPLPLEANWQLPLFDLWYYVRNANWTTDTLLPLLGLALAGLLAIRSVYQAPLRFLFLIHVGGCLILAALLPMATFRYGYHFVPFSILLTSAVLVIGARALTKAARAPQTPAFWRRYASGLGLALVVIGLVLGSGLTIQLAELPSLRVYNYGITTYKFPGIAGPIRYLREHLREGDVVIANLPHQVTLLMDRPGWSTDYTLESVLTVPLELSDAAPVLRDARNGARALVGLPDLEELFAHRRRIWYVAIPDVDANMNPGPAPAYLREHMEVVCEGWSAALLLGGQRHWPAAQQQQAEQQLPAGRGAAPTLGGWTAFQGDETSKGLIAR